MFRKGRIALACLAVAMTAIWSWAATTWQLQTKLNSSGGTLQVRNSAPQTSVGSTVYANLTTSANVNVTVAAKTGYVISAVTKSGVAQAVPANATSLPVSFAKTGGTLQSLVASFAARQVAVGTSVNGAGSVTPLTGSVNYGSNLTLTATPSASNGFVSSVTVTGASYTTSPLPSAGPVTIALTNVTANATVAVGFGAASANAGADKVAATHDPVQLTGSGSGGTLGWTQVSGPAATLSSSTAATPFFTPATAGLYVFQLSVSNGGKVLATSTAQITVVDSAINYLRSSCNGCHSPQGASPSNSFRTWSTSRHKVNNVGCLTCHSNGPMPPTQTTADINVVCAGCHTVVTNHSAATTGPKLCSDCHDAHNPETVTAQLSQSAHPAVTLYTFEEIGMQMAGGAKVPVQVDASGKGMPYSPKQTCGTAGCHVKNGIDYTYDKISDHAFHSNQGRSEYVDSASGKFDATKNKPWTQSTAMVGKW